jgi:5-methylcytosine-specific restriction enzyme B
MTFTNPSDHAVKVLRLLKKHHNVLISGAPATGKSRLLAEVRYWFTNLGGPAFHATGKSAFPAHETALGQQDWLPSPDRKARKVHTITFHQGTKYRDFVSGLIPIATPGMTGFRVTAGPLLRAAREAMVADCSTLVEVDEVNRGPAVAIFGDTITAIESDKRLLANGQKSGLSSSFMALKDDGGSEETFIPAHTYIVAAMNQADTSVEPLDVAFLRRFQPYELVPDVPAVRTHLGLKAGPTALPAEATDVTHLKEAMVQAWVRINERISLARGEAFQLGHGVFFDGTTAGELNAAYALQVWSRLLAHVSEIFFGDTHGMGAALKAGEPGNPFAVNITEFANTPVARLNKSVEITQGNIYALLRAIAQP